MKKFLLNLLKIVFLVLLFVLAAVGSYALVTYMGWPWWAGASLFGGVIGLVAAFFFIRKWMLRRREKRFVKRIVDQDDSAIAAAPLHERSRLQELQSRWMEAVHLLQNSQLRRHGNPLYALPWYMIFGESDSGKSTAVSSSRLTSILSDIGPTPGVSATRNCDWWFFEEAVILDTAGRYAIPLDESRDKEEWEKFLTLLVKYRKREPLNGLIITLPADRLQSGDEDSLHEYGRSLRRRINELMRVLGVRFPVYVLLTKMDLVFGLKGLAEVLPAEARSQAMGMVNETEVSDPEEFVNIAVTGVIERLRELRVNLLERDNRFDPAFLLFADELDRLRPRISAFADGVFEDNPYQEQPFFRGIYFSSGEQSGEQSSAFLDSLPSLENVQKKLPGTRQGLFLHDFFSKVLTRDRNLFTPIIEFLKWKLLTRNLGMLVWLLLLFFICGLFSMSFLGNRRALRDLFTAFPKPPEFSENIDERIVEMEGFRQKILHLHELNSGWWVPRMGLDVSLEAEQKVQQLYVEKFDSVLLKPVDEKLSRSIEGLHAGSSEQDISDFVKLLGWRIDLLDDRIEGKKSKPLAPYELPSGQALSVAVQNFDPDLMKYYAQTYSSYLDWGRDVESFKEQRLLLQARLAKVFSLKGADFKWLVDWVDANPEVQPVVLRDFWGGPRLHFENEVHVPPAYTDTGRKMLEDFLAELRRAMPDNSGFGQREKDFWSWYAEQFYRAWYSFSEHFSEGERQLLTKDDYINMAHSMANPDNPYFKLLGRMKEEFSSIKGLGTPPEWVTDLFDFNIVLVQYKAVKAKGVEESSRKAEESLRKIVADLGGTMAKNIEARIEGAKQIDDYMKVLNDLAGFTTSQETAFKSAAALYPSSGQGAGAGSGEGKSGEGAVKKNPVDGATRAMAALRTRMHGGGQGTHTFWNLVAGPLEFMVYVITMEASCELQELWEGKVLAETAHVPADKLRSTLFGKSGIVDKFTAGSAAPFLSKGVKGWQSEQWLGIPFPFREEFFVFLNDGEQGAQEIQPEYKVGMSTIPTSVNSNATEEPYATMLSLECGSGKQELVNYNYSEKMVFKWKPDQCGTTTLTIRFPGLDLVKTYEGSLGFAKFLSEFRNGEVNFTPDDFPEQSKGLKGLGVESVKVGYNFSGAVPVIEVLKIKPLNVPNFITDCWQN
ncbi:type VI secretion protein IcmF/TssM N-terminal domain-containing protein [Maridesulfovibrio sp.]|uniref:type VI secretion protein IcmF/TssM N-terminal domain-containing protein n=1 Tax=Maridesulfovibrio sp. TaxID=2795000 RepID=UPI0029C9CC78|nr:type VI secretion protein IcmF/TssM N-terminal domain-containing protein [Maridesulfovibrio sp.]